MDIGKNMDVPIILGHTFLATIGALIDVKNVKLTLQLGEAKEEFDVLKAVRHFDSVEDLDACFMVDVIDPLLEFQCVKEISNDHLETCLHLSSDMQDDDKELKAQAQYLEERGYVRRERFEPLDRPPKEEKPTTPSKPELATLPSHLKYLFLDKE